jgi:hypothetical protein
MARQKRSDKARRKVPKALTVLVRRLMDSPRARKVLTRAVLHAASVLVREHPRAALALAGAGASSLAKGTAHAVADKAKDTLRSAAGRLHLVDNPDEPRRQRG